MELMTTAPIKRLIVKLAIPAIVSMLVMAVYNLVDTFFVSQISTSASGAVGIVFSLMTIIQTLGFTVAEGAGNYISRLLGKSDVVTSEKVAATGVFTAVIFGTLFSIIVFLFLEPTIWLLGATETIAPHAMSYASYILIGTPYIMAMHVLDNLLRSQGHAFYVMISIGAGAILNIGLDPIFIFTLGMGVGGAALATIISNFISVILLLTFNIARKKGVKIRLRNFTPRLAIYKEMLRFGIPTFFRQGLAAVSAVSLTVAAASYGDAAVSAMAILSRISFLISWALIGFGMGFLPFCGFNYGAGRIDRVLQGFKFCLKVSTIGLAIISVVGFLAAPDIIAVFRRDDAAVIELGTFAFRIFCITLTTQGFVFMTNTLYQSIGKSFGASMLSLARQGLFFIPLVVILPTFMGVMGVQISQPIADFATFILALPFGISIIRKLHKLANDNISTPQNIVSKN